MIVLEGTPGVGKTTLLGRLLEALPDRLVIFPEAQPPLAGPSMGDAAIIRHLLAEDRARIDAAKRLRDADPEVVVASDRCHIGVLAYRSALCATGRAPRGDLDRALALADSLQLGEGHRDDSILILLIDPGESIDRRHGFAHDPRYQIWYDLDFLAAYNHALQHLPEWTPITNPAIEHVTVEASGWSWLLGVLPPGSAPQSVPQLLDADPATQGGGLRCPSVCTATETRSRVVLARGAVTQLSTKAVHRQRAGGTVTCLQKAEHVAAAWLANGREAAW